MLIPSQSSPTVVGFSYETIQYLLGGSIRGSYYTLNDNIINGRIRGVAGVVGCNNCRTTQDASHMVLIKELIKNDVIVLSTGCAAMAAGKYGLLTPEAAKYCGEGLAEVCETVGIPPVLPHGGLRGQLPHPDGGHRLRQGRRPGHGYQRPARAGARPSGCLRRPSPSASTS